MKFKLFEEWEKSSIPAYINLWKEACDKLDMTCIDPKGRLPGPLVTRISEMKKKEMFWLPFPTGSGKDYLALGMLSTIFDTTTGNDDGNKPVTYYYFNNTPDDFPDEVHELIDSTYEGVNVEYTDEQLEKEIKDNRIFFYVYTDEFIKHNPDLHSKRGNLHGKKFGI